MTPIATRPTTRNENIPLDLKNLPQWARWIRGSRDKMPANLDNTVMLWGTPSNWLEFDQVAPFDQIGIILARENGIIPIDFDGCRNKETGEIDPHVLQWIQEAHTYAEVSPSETGIKMYLRGALPAEIKEIEVTNVPWRTSPDQKHVGIEIYGQRHFLTITGNIIPGCPLVVNEAPAVLNDLLIRFAPPPKVRKQSKGPEPSRAGAWDFDAWVRHHCDVIEVLPDGYLIRCPWEHEHSTPGDTARIWEGPPHTFHCFHAHCKGRIWQDVRTYYEPAAYTFKEHTQEFKVSRHAASASSNGNGNHAGNIPAPGKAQWSFNRTDLGNAERLVARHGRNMRYCHSMNSWIIWNEQQWAEDKSGEAERLAKETVRSIYGEAEAIADDTPEGKAERKAIAAHAMKSESKARIRDMLILAQSERSMPVKREQLDADPWLLNVANGTIDLHTGQLREHIPADLITKCLTTPYIPDAPCPLWHSFLNTIFDGNADLIRFMQRALGYALTGDTGEQCFFLLYGRGHNGKSTLLEVVQAILSEYAQSAEFKAFLARDNEGIRNDIARMNGKRLVVAKESDKGKHLAEALVKQLTGGDTITARFLHQEFFDFKPQFKLFLAANHKPEIKGTDLGIWRRVRLIPFTVTISDEKRDKDLPSKLAQEAPGILAWLVQGCMDWQRTGLGMPDEVQKATTSYQKEMNVAARFLDGSCDFGKDKKVQSSTLKEAFKSWCEDVSGESYDAKQLQAVLLDRNCTSARGTGGKYVWHGVTLKSEPPTPESEPPGSLFERKSEPSEPSEPKKGNLPFEGEINRKIPDSTSLGSLGSLFEYPFDAIKLASSKPLSNCRFCHRDYYVPRLKGEQWIWACDHCHPEVAQSQGREYVDTLDGGK